MQVASRAATSVVLLTVLLTGMATPAGACALMCVRHQGLESRPHCGQPSDAMPRMVHDHTAMKHAAVGAMRPVVGSQSCKTNCFAAERQTVSRKTFSTVTPVHSSAVTLDIAAKRLTLDFARSRRVDGTPPGTLPINAPLFSILRI